MKETYSGNVSKPFFSFLLGTITLSLLFIVSRYNYLIFHTLAELFSIVIAWGLFVIVWNTRNIVKNDAIVFLGIAYLFIGGLDLFHTLSYKGMGVLGPERGANPATQLWIVARYTESITLCIFPFLLGKRIKVSIPIAFYSIASAIAFSLIFIWDLFPVCYIDGVGLTIFKKNSEYIICMLLLAAFIFLYKKNDLLDQTAYKFLAISIVLTIIGELAFTFYVSVYGLSNLIGHFFKIISFYLIYKAFIYTGLTKPFGLMFKEISENEERLRKLSNLTFEGIVIHRKGVIIDINKAFQKIMGYTKKELIGKNIIDDISIPPEYRAILKENVAKNKALPYEIMARRKNGQLFPIEIESKNIKSNDDEFRVTAVRDITDRKLAEDALEKSNQELKSIFRAAPTGIGMIRDRIIKQVNDRFCDIIGYSRNELIGQNSRIVYPSDEEYEYVGKEKYNQISKKGTGTVETKLQKKDGTIIDILLSSTPIDLDDLSKGVTFTALDISYGKAKEKELLDSEQKYKTIMESMKEPIYIGSSDFIVKYMNPAMIKRTGRDATGEDCFRAIHNLDGRCPWCHSDDSRDGNTHELDVVSPKDNHSFHISVTPIVNDDGSISTLNVFRDVTEFKKMETNLQQAQKMEAIGTLAGGIAHDFNNILGAIIGYTEMARDDSPKESSIVKDLDKVLEASDRAANLVKQILAFSRQGDAEHILLSPAVVVKKTITMLRPTLPATIEITQNIDTKTGLIFADPTQIHQILMNLCTNAFHAMEETGGRLDVSLKETELSEEDLTHEQNIEAGNFVKLSVCDSGSGMTQKLKDKIFDPYFTTKEIGKGTGLGLSIVHGIVKSYGGFLTLYSQPGEGTAFHIFLPVINKEVLLDKEAIQQIPIGVEKILFIDDEELLADMGKDILERLGYHVTLRKNSLEALETFRNQPDQFDLVITDQTMPGMTGADLARRMLQIRPDIPIILCTGYSSIMTEEKAKSMGIREFALKPLTKKNIATLIRKVLDGNQE